MKVVLPRAGFAVAGSEAGFKLDRGDVGELSDGSVGFLDDSEDGEKNGEAEPTEARLDCASLIEVSVTLDT